MNIIAKELDEYLEHRKELNLDMDEVYKTVANTLLLILVLIVIPLIIFISQLYKSGQEVSYFNNWDTNSLIEKIYNKQIYGRIRNV